MATANRLDVIVAAKIDDYIRDMKKAENQTGKFEKKSTGIIDKLKNNWLKIAGAIGAVKAAVDITKEAAKFEQSAQAMANQFGKSADEVIAKLNEASQGTISNAQLVESANRAMALGVTDNLDDMTKLLELARIKAQAMGIDTTQAFNDIVTGIGRGSPLILDNLGLIIKGWAKEAEASGNAAGAQTLMNMVLKDGAVELENFNEKVLTNYERFQSIGAAFENVRIKLGEFLLPIFNDIFDIIQSVTQVFTPLITKTGEAAQGFDVFGVVGKGIQVVLLGVKTIIDKFVLTIRTLILGLSELGKAALGLQSDKRTLDNIKLLSQEYMRQNKQLNELAQQRWDEIIGKGAKYKSELQLQNTEMKKQNANLNETKDKQEGISRAVELERDKREEIQPLITDALDVANQLFDTARDIAVAFGASTEEIAMMQSAFNDAIGVAEAFSKGLINGIVAAISAAVKWIVELFKGEEETTEVVIKRRDVYGDMLDAVRQLESVVGRINDLYGDGEDALQAQLDLLNHQLDIYKQALIGVTEEVNGSFSEFIALQMGTSPELNRLQELFDTINQSGEVTLEQYTELQKLLADLRAAGYSDTLIEDVQNALDAAEGLIETEKAREELLEKQTEEIKQQADLLKSMAGLVDVQNVVNQQMIEGQLREQGLSGIELNRELQNIGVNSSSAGDSVRTTIGTQITNNYMVPVREPSIDN